MKMRLLLAFTLFLPNINWAQDTPLFTCQILNTDKKIEISQDPENLIFTFGPAGAPELRVVEPKSSPLHKLWNGIGRTIWEGVGFENLGHIYELTTAIDTKDAVDNPTNIRIANLSVTKSGETLATLSCDLNTVQYVSFAFEDAIFGQ